MTIRLTVSALADQAGLSPDAVRYYQRLGLLQPPARSPAGYRLYDHATVDRLRLIKGAQRVGLRLREIRELLQVVDRGQCPCGHTKALLARRLAEIDAELARLGALRTTLAGLLAQAPRAPAPRPRPASGGACRRSPAPRRRKPRTRREVAAMAACPDCGCPCGERPCPCCGAP
jgi:DNA-binding transcriptional MerR regulator